MDKLFKAERVYNNRYFRCSDVKRERLELQRELEELYDKSRNDIKIINDTKDKRSIINKFLHPTIDDSLTIFEHLGEMAAFREIRELIKK